MIRVFAFILIGTAAASAGCATTGATPRPFPTPNAPATTPVTTPVPAPAAGHAMGYSVAGTALSLRGTPYRNGGTDPAGFDCSGFVTYVFGQNGVKVPRTVTEQFHAGHEVAGPRLEPGDLVFFTTVGPGASHVGIAIGGDEFVHAPSSAGEVRVERMSASYWARRFVGARRVL